VGFQNSATGFDLGVYAARSYSLMRPPSTGRRLICSRERSAAGWSGRGGAESAAAVGPSSVVVPGVLGQDRPQVPFTEDQHPVGDLGPGGEYEPFGIGVRPGAAGRDLHGLDTGAGQDRVEGVGELPGPVADQEPEIGGVIAEVHQEIPDLLRGPRAVRGPAAGVLPRRGARLGQGAQVSDVMSGVAGVVVPNVLKAAVLDIPLPALPGDLF
jgi:hypothetical protein